MRKALILTLAIALSTCFAAGIALAGPASKASCNVGAVAVVPAKAEWSPIFTNTIKMAEQKDLFVDVSLEVGLTTNTKVMSKQLARAISTAEAMVLIRVVVDDVLALPEEVTFARREQTLVAEFAGDLTGCIDEEGHVIIDPDGECIEPETLALILDTMGAHSFNFIMPNVGVGEHTVTVEAKIAYSVDGIEDTDYPATNAYLGNGSVTVESVRMINSKDEAAEL